MVSFTMYFLTVEILYSEGNLTIINVRSHERHTCKSDKTAVWMAFYHTVVTSSVLYAHVHMLDRTLGTP